MPVTQTVGRYQRIWLAIFPTFQLTTGVYAVITQGYSIYLTWGNLSLTCELTGAFLQLVMCTMKTALLVGNGKRLHRLVERMDQLQNAQACKMNNKRILQRTQLKSQEFTVFYTKLGIGLIVVIMTAIAVGGYFDHATPYR